MKSSLLPHDTSSVRRHLPFIAASLAIAACLLFGIVFPLLGWAFADDGSLAERRDMLLRYREVAAQENAVRNYVSQVKESNSRGDLLEGASQGIVTAALQSRLKTMAEAAGVSIQSIQALPVKTLGSASRESPDSGGAASRPAAPPQLFGARIAFTGSIGMIRKLAQAIETGPPLLLVTSVVMTQAVNWRPSTVEQEPLIQAQLDVYGGALTGGRP